LGMGSIVRSCDRDEPTRSPVNRWSPNAGLSPAGHGVLRSTSKSLQGDAVWSPLYRRSGHANARSRISAWHGGLRSESKRPALAGRPSGTPLGGLLGRSARCRHGPLLAHVALGGVPHLGVGAAMLGFVEGDVDRLLEGL